MDSQKKKHEGSGNYGYGYGGSSPYGYSGYGPYGYPSQSSGANVLERTLKDYLAILRERVWYVVIGFILIVSAVAIYTFNQTPRFESTATVQVFRKEPTVMQVQQVVDSQINTVEDLNTQINLLKSDSIVQQVVARLSPGELQRFLAPYQEPGHPPPSPDGIIAKYRVIAPERLSLIIDIQYQHPDRVMAAKIANLIADEYITYNANIEADESTRAVRELQQQADVQRTKVDGIANALQSYREKNKMISLDQRRDIVTATLKDLNTNLTDRSAVLQDAETRWNQIVAAQHRGDDLLNLSFIASVPLVAQLRQQVATQKIALAQLSQRYRPKHPQMIAATQSLDEAQNELQGAIGTTVAQVNSEYQTALQNYAQSQKALATQTADSLTLDRYGVEYSNMERDYDVNEKLLEQIIGRMRETSVNGTIETQNARIVDRAIPGYKAVWPKYWLILGLGLVGGMGFGVGLAFFIAYFDDRVKSSYDIETVIGLPLLGIIPEVKKMNKPEEMASAVAANEEREVTEAFSTLFSGLQLKDESKNARCLLTTSTVAGEGKSFITTNLATTYASHGERVVIVDCDLRRPAVHRVFRIENLKGVIDVCTGEGSLDDVTVRNVRPNLDVIPTGGRAKNPSQTLNSKNFAAMVSELRKRYDRVFIDTPPVAIVSDALIVMPLVDGSIYAIFFNKAKRKAAQYCAQRLLETNVPVFGAVLNGLSGGFGGYYYSHYYGKNYKDYYVTKSEELTGAGEKIVEPEKKRGRG